MLEQQQQPFNGPLSGTTQVSRYQKDKTNLDFTEATDSEWQWHQLGRMQVCNSLQTDNHHASTTPLSFFQAGCPSCRPTNSVKALKALYKLQRNENSACRRVLAAFAADRRAAPKFAAECRPSSNRAILPDGRALAVHRALFLAGPDLSGRQTGQLLWGLHN